MLVRSFVRSLVLVSVLVASLAAAACGHHASPAPAAPAPPTDATHSLATGGGASSFTLDGTPWTIAVAGTIDADGEYGQRLTTSDGELSLMPWPRADAFVQTLAEHLDSTRQEDPSLQVLHQVDGGAGSFEAVLATSGAIDGTVLVPDPAGGDGVMCGYKLAAGADWHPALAACKSIARAGE